MPVLEGARELVSLLSGADIPVAIVSGSSRAEIKEALVELGFESQLAFYMGAEDYPEGKPAPDGYLKAARRLNVEPKDCLVFEDSEAGIASARNAGMRVVATSAANREVVCKNYGPRTSPQLASAAAAAAALVRGGVGGKGLRGLGPFIHQTFICRSSSRERSNCDSSAQRHRRWRL